MLGNIPIPELPHDENVWLMLFVSAIRDRRSPQGRAYKEIYSRNSTGTLTIRIWNDTIEHLGQIKPGLWRITGKVEIVQDRAQFITSEYEPITLDQYREHQMVAPVLPRAYTIDIETLSIPDFRERVGAQLERSMRLGNMRVEQLQRYLEDIVAEEERCYALGSLTATSGRVLCIAVHVGPIPGLEFVGIEQHSSEVVFGIDEAGVEQAEKKTLSEFLTLMNNFDPEADEIVGHNIIGFDLPFIFQRCVVNDLKVRTFVNLSDFNVRGVFDTMHRWWLGARRTVSLDDLAWALGIESSKTAEVEGSKVFDLYQAGKLNLIREYNLNDVRVTRRVYERMVQSLGR
jgi:Predicted 3'-5' exonuclease related to the exonuclease domain of PolB